MNQPTLTKLTLIVAAALSLGATAGAVDLSKLPPASTQDGVVFDKDIKPLFDASCTRCHGAERPKGGLRLDSLEGVLKGGKDGKVVQPGKSEKSAIVIAVAQLDPETAMPPKPRARRGGPGGPGTGAPGNPGAGGPAGEHREGAAAPAPGAQSAQEGHAGPNGPGQRNAGPPPKPLTPEQVGLVRAWIDQGAK